MQILGRLVQVHLHRMPTRRRYHVDRELDSNDSKRATTVPDTTFEVAMRSRDPERGELGWQPVPTSRKRFTSAIGALLLLATYPFLVPQSIAAETYTIAVIGTGDMGSALGKKFAAAGHRIVYGSREPSSDTVKNLVAATGHGATATTQRTAAQQGSIVILAVPWAPMEQVVTGIGDLRGKILIDISTAYRQAADGYLELPDDSSTSELVQKWAPGARVVKTAFSAASVIEDPSKYGEPTVTYIAADDRGAKEIVARLAIQLNLFPIDAGPLRMAKSIDHMGLLYLTPLVQGRDLTWIWAPRVAVDYSCKSTDGWFRPVKDAADLASLPNLEGINRECASK